MKTPLALIAGNTELLEDTGPSEAIIEGLKDGTRRLTAHIEQILDYSALLSGTLPLYKTEVDLAEVARQVAGVVQERVRRKELAFALAVDPGTPPIQGDFRRLVQMILALLDNAEKFTPARGQIGLRIGPSDGLVRIDVWDTGPGIPEADFARIWEAFSQLELGDADSKGGLGLGLTIVKQLAELHGGKVGVVSLPGKGTTFSLLLPVGAAQPPLSEPAGPPPSQGQP
jgi:signal transduction histidine kinase